MKKLVIFDLDGTLLYTLEDLANSVNFTLDLFGYPVKTLEEISSFVGNGVQHLLRQSLPSDISEKDFELCLACFKDHYEKHCCEKTRPYDGIIETLQQLKEKGVIVGIVSNKFQSAADDCCEHYFKDLYNSVMGESEICRRKPSPDGIKTAENAGVFCVSVLWGYRDQIFLSKNGARLFINRPDEIIDLID